MNKLIYLDNAATTKTSPEVVTAMLPYFTEHYGNPSSVYGFASANKEVITKQREIIAGVLGVGQLGADRYSRGLRGERKAHHYQQDRAPCHSAHLCISGETGI